MDISKFNNALLYSNKNVEKLAKKLVNESANAALMEMFDDKCILADHTTGQIFEAKYKFDGNTFVFEDFEEVQLEHNNDALKEAISDYFDDADISLKEAYESNSGSNSDVFEESLTEALAGKNMDNVINYSELSGINEEIGDVKKSDTFKVYTERLAKVPTNSIKLFDWKNPVRVSLIDEDKNKILNKSMKAKAKKLKTDANFKKELAEAAMEALNGDESLLEDLIKENISIVALDNAELKESIGLSVVGNRTLMENRNKIVDMINTIVEEDEELASKKTEVEASASTEDEKKDDAPEAKEQDVSAIKSALETAKSKATDEKLVSKIEDIISSLDTASSAGETDVGAVKEAVELLSL